MPTTPESLTSSTQFLTMTNMEQPSEDVKASQVYANENTLHLNQFIDNTNEGYHQPAPSWNPPSSFSSEDFPATINQDPATGINYGWGNMHNSPSQLNALGDKVAGTPEELARDRHDYYYGQYGSDEVIRSPQQSIDYQHTNNDGVQYPYASDGDLVEKLPPYRFRTNRDPEEVWKMQQQGFRDLEDFEDEQIPDDWKARFAKFFTGGSSDNHGKNCLMRISFLLWIGPLLILN